MSSVINFPIPETNIQTDEELVALMRRAQAEVFEGKAKEFEEAYGEALATQIVELYEANNGFSTDLAEELADAMRAVLLQWLGEYPCCPREDSATFLLSMSSR